MDKARRIQLHYNNFEIAQANHDNPNVDSPDVIPSPARQVTIVSDQWGTNMAVIEGANSSAQYFDFSEMGVPPPAATPSTHLTHVTHTYPAARFTADRSKSSASATQEHMAWWKSNNSIAWSVLKTSIDIIQLRTFSAGVFVILDFEELWNTSINYWCPLHSDLDVPQIDLANPLLHRLFRDRVASVRGGHLAKTKLFFPFPKKGQAAVDEDIDPEELINGLPCYPFIVKASPSPTQLWHNRKLLQRMVSANPFSCINEEGIVEIFGCPILQSAVMLLYTGGKRVTWKEVPIGLRWRPNDGRVLRELFPYAGMLLIHWANYIMTGVKKELGPEDQANYDILWGYATRNWNDHRWEATRENMYREAERQLLGN